MSSFYDICSSGDVEKVLFMLSNENIVLDDGLAGACFGGHIKIINLIMEKGATNFDRGLASGCQGGQKKIIELLISKGANNFNWGLVQACLNGYIEIVKIIIEKGATDFNWGLYCACKYKDIALLMIEKGANMDNCSIPLNIEDIYYLYQRKINISSRYEELYNTCKNAKSLFQQTLQEILNITDLVNFTIEF